MQRAEVGATEGIAWELLWKLVNIKQAQHEPQSLTAMVNNALPSFLKGAEGQGRNLESTRHVVQAVEGALQPPGKDRSYDNIHLPFHSLSSMHGPHATILIMPQPCDHDRLLAVALDVPELS